MQKQEEKIVCKFEADSTTYCWLLGDARQQSENKKKTKNPKIYTRKRNVRKGQIRYNKINCVLDFCIKLKIGELFFSPESRLDLTQTNKTEKTHKKRNFNRQREEKNRIELCEFAYHV